MSIITWSISQPTCHSLEEILQEALSNKGLRELDTWTPGSNQMHSTQKHGRESLYQYI